MVTELQQSLLDLDQTAEQALIRTRRELHERPELSGQEAATAEYIAARLRRFPFDNLRERVGGYGVVADVRGKHAGRSVLVRADMDGLPLQEATELSFRSKNQGVMHACGHDVHMAIAVAVAETFARNRDRLPGTVRFAFQPAEEKAGGAKPMIEAGVLEGIDRVIGLHVWSELPVGQVSLRPDVVMASADMFTLTVSGKGGHGAQPHLTVDAVVIAAQIVGALQTLVSRESAPSAPVVLTIGSIHGGSAGNIVAGEVVLEGTLRTFDKAVRERILQRMAELADGIARSMRGRAQLRRDSETIPVVNDAAMAEHVSNAIAGVLGDAALMQLDPLTVGEDFAYFLEARPGCFFMLGGAPADGPTVHHTPGFRVDERCLGIGYRAMGAAVLALLEIA
ncbi:MAG TPA: M20 family metallopeptidase [Candidatus Dormibacteraeota bacterium]